MEFACPRMGGRPKRDFIEKLKLLAKAETHLKWLMRVHTSF